MARSSGTRHGNGSKGPGWGGPARGTAFDPRPKAPLFQKGVKRGSRVAPAAIQGNAENPEPMGAPTPPAPPGVAVELPHGVSAMGRPKHVGGAR